MKTIMTIWIVATVPSLTSSAVNAHGYIIEGPACTWIPGPFRLIWTCN
jgi:hypothetical protein